MVVIEEPRKQTAERAAEWLTRNPAPADSARTAEELDHQIASEREVWL